MPSVPHSLGAILNIRLEYHLSEIVGAAGHGGAGQINTNDVTAIQALPEPIKSWVLEAFTRSMDDVFLVAVPFMAVAFVIALTMREKPLRRPGHAGYRFRNTKRVGWHRPRLHDTLSQLWEGHLADGTLDTKSVHQPCSMLSYIGKLMPNQGNAQAVRGRRNSHACDHPGGVRRIPPPSGRSGSQQPAPPSPTAAAPTPTPDPIAFKSNVKNGASKVKVDTLVSYPRARGP